MFLFGICLVVQLFSAEHVLEWGPGIHTVVALSAVDSAAMMLPSVSKIITSFPLEYMYGSLAADFVIGKNKTRRSGHPHNWTGGFKSLTEAGDECQAAFSYGLLSHLAADVVAHNFFVPNLFHSHPAGRGMGHLYWEAKADYLVGPGYIKIARDVLKMDHRGCDRLLHLIAGKRRKGLKAKKHLYKQSVKFSDYLYATHPLLFAGKMIPWQVFHEYLAFMVGLSCRVVKNLLANPDSSLCLLYDPMGKQTLRLAKRGFFTKFFNARHPNQQFALDQEFLEL